MQQGDFNMEVANIKTINFNVMESAYSTGKEIEFTLSCSAVTLLNFGILVVAIGQMHYKGEKTSLSSMCVETHFKTSDFPTINNRPAPPESAAVVMVSLSFTHLRALWFQSLARTRFDDKIMYILNPADLAKKVFTESFPAASNPENN